MTQPRLIDMDASGLAFHLREEEGRTREDARLNASSAIDILTMVRATADRRDAQMMQHDDPLMPKAWRMDLPNEGRAILMWDEGVARLVVERGTTTLLTCDIAARWRKPVRRDLVAAADLFLRAARGAADPAPGDRARERMLGHAAVDLSRGIIRCTLGAEMPWRDGTREVDIESVGNPWHSTSSWSRVRAAEVGCSYTYSGIVLSISPLVIDLGRGDLDPLEMLRLISGLGDEA